MGFYQAPLRLKIVIATTGGESGVEASPGQNPYKRSKYPNRTINPLVFIKTAIKVFGHTCPNHNLV